MSTPQEQVVNAVKARGYWEGYTAYQMLARNLVKMAEELAEATEKVFLDADMATTDQLPIDAMFTMVGLFAKARFDDRDAQRWYDPGLLSLGLAQSTAKELADMQVVLFNAAQALAEYMGEPFDVVQAAVGKATTDVSRGVRGAQS